MPDVRSDLHESADCYFHRLEGPAREVMPHREWAARFKDAATASLGERLKALYVIGSTAVDDHGPGSDLDLIVIVDEVDSLIIEKVHDILRAFPSGEKGECVVQPYLWSLARLRAKPSHHFYISPQLLHGKALLQQPAAAELKPAFCEISHNLMNTLTHYLIIEHDASHVAGRVYDKLKQLFSLLAIEERWKSGEFPRNRADLVSRLKARGDLEGAELMILLSGWSSGYAKAEIAKDPKPMLLRMLKYSEDLAVRWTGEEAG